MNKKEKICLPSSITAAKQLATIFINDIKNESSAPAAGYRNKPKSYDYFRYGTRAVQEKLPHPAKNIIDTPPKRLKTSPTDSGGNNNRNEQRGSGREQKVSFADKNDQKDPEKELMRKQGFLVQPSSGKIPKYSKVIEGKRICGGHVFIGKYCFRGKDCPCHHPNSAEQVPSSGRANFVKWVNAKENKINFVQGKKSKRSEWPKNT